MQVVQILAQVAGWLRSWFSLGRLTGIRFSGIPSGTHGPAKAGHYVRSGRTCREAKDDAKNQQLSERRSLRASRCRWHRRRSSAHHAFAAEFDATKPVKFEKAVVRKMEWVNPHVWIHIEVPAAGGKVEQWAIEAGTPNVLFRRGFTKEALLPGTIIVVEGYRAKDGSRRANGRDLTLPDGRTLFLGSSGTGAPIEKP